MQHLENNGLMSNEKRKFVKVKRLREQLVFKKLVMRNSKKRNITVRVSWINYI